MESLPLYLALNGAAALTVGLVAGLLLYRANLINGNVPGWHLLHSGGSARGILLIALAGMVRLLVLPPWQLAALVWLMVFFVWTSVFAMFIVATSGERGFGWNGSIANKLAYILYVVGTVAVFPAVFLLLNAL